MFTAHSNRNRRPSSGPLREIPTICVVDPQSQDYSGWGALAEASGLQFKIVATAEEALRFSHAHAVCLWVVNLDLPGLAGDELCGMLHSRHSRAAVMLLADRYTPEAEQAAWRARATIFAVKPSQTTCFQHWLSPSNLHPLHAS